MQDLFSDNQTARRDALNEEASSPDSTESQAYAPLANRMRPRQLSEYVGQQHLFGEDKPLYQSIKAGRLHSMILWGPPGTGKTTLAKLIARQCDCHFIAISAVLGSVKEIRAAVAEAQHYRASGRKTLLFVDEVHRFNKSQQDAFLPYVEDGTFIFIGATTENPSFEVNNALLSRARVYVLRALDSAALEQVLARALEDKERGFGKQSIRLDDKAKDYLIGSANGDARRLLNLLEMAVDVAEAMKTAPGDEIVLTLEHLSQVAGQSMNHFDKGGDRFYDQISALHKSVRGSNPDAALYWFCRMLDGGCDPLYIARRVVRMASEDIGNADPRGLQIALNAWDVQQRLGSPEGELAIAQALVYLAVAAKSNAVYSAYKAAREFVAQTGDAEVPIHIRNAPTKLMKELGMGAEYRYDHDEPDAFARGQTYFPDELGEQVFYQPVERGLEKQIAEKMKFLRGKG